MRTRAGWIPVQIAALVAAGCSVGTDDEKVENETQLKPEVMRVANETASEPLAQSASFRLPETETDSLQSLPVEDDKDHAREGRSAWEAGEPALAARELRIAVDRGEASDYEIYLLGLSLWKSGDLEESEAVLADATWRLDDFAKAPVNLARVRLALGETSSAEEAVRKAIEIDPDYGPAHNVLGRTLLARGLGDEAAAAFKRAAELSDADPWPHNNLGYLMLVEGRHGEAIEPLERALEIDEGLAVAWHNLALARERSGEAFAAASAAARAGSLASNETYAATAARLGSLAPPTSGVAAAAAATERADSETPAETASDGENGSDEGDAVAETASLGAPATR